MAYLGQNINFLGLKNGSFFLQKKVADKFT